MRKERNEPVPPVVLGFGESWHCQMLSRTSANLMRLFLELNATFLTFLYLIIHRSSPCSLGVIMWNYQVDFKFVSLNAW